MPFPAHPTVMTKALSRKRSHISSDYDLIANESKTCRKLAKFPELPTEIRLLIWRNAIPEARVIPIRYRHLTSAYTARIQPPVVLHISRESRELGLTVYHELNLGPLKNTGCYVDLTRDTVYLTTDVFFGGVVEHETLKFKPDQVRGGVRPQIHYFTLPKVRSVFTNTEIAHPLQPQPVKPPSYNHAQAILSDLLDSDDGLKVLENLHIDDNTWRWLSWTIVHFRHQIPKHPSKVVMVSELYVELLPTNIVLNRRTPTPSEPPTAPNCFDRGKVARGFAVKFEKRNRKDERNGKPAVLPTEFVPVYLDDAEGEQTLKMLHGAGSTQSRFSALPEEEA